MDGLTVLVEAKKEYLAQLCCVMCPHMITTFENLYTESGNISKGKQVLVQYQKLLKEVPNWNNHMIHQHAEKMSSSCSWFNDLLAAVFVSYVKILSSVRINSDSKKISLKLPSNDVFVHGCFTNAAKELYKDPYVYHDEMTEYERDANLTRRFIACIEATVKEMIPIQEILKTYISHKNDIEINKETTEEDLDTEDPEIDEGGDAVDAPESEETQPPLDPSVAPPVTDPPVSDAATTEAPGGGTPGTESAVVAAADVKNINVATNNDDVLFPDAH